MSKANTVSSYLIHRLYDYGVRHIFGVPGDYALGFYHVLEEGPLKVVNTCDEQGAGFAADAYARINGLGAVCITYCVGGLKVANTTAQAFAEKSPVVVISGAPGTQERTKRPLLHHKVRDFDTQSRVFEHLTVASTVLNDPKTACREIDRVIDAALKYKRPVYIELPRDVVTASVHPTLHPSPESSVSESNALREALQEASAMINTAEKPVIIAGVEIHRFGLQNLLLRLLERTRIPVASTLLSKSVVRENHPQYLGVYEGAMGRTEVRDYVESSDCLILLGAFMTDINLGIFTAHLDQGKSISISSEKLSVHYHSYENVTMKDFLQGLLRADIKGKEQGNIPQPPSLVHPRPGTNKPISIKYLFERLNAFIDDDTIVIADPGDAMFAAVDMTIHGATEFLSPAYYTSLGFAVPAALGVQLIKPKLRPLVLVGDGAFQMSGMELSTITRFKLCPIIVVLNNKGYGTERPMIDGRFNDVHPWQYSRLPEIFQAGKGFAIHTEDQLETALSTARNYRDGFCILDVHINPDDRSPALYRLTAAMKTWV